MDPEPDVIRQQIEQTRSSLTEKLETLESQVKETVETVKAKVEGTVDSVTSTVESTVNTVKNTFDLERQVRAHPFGMTGGGLLLGVAMGYAVSSLLRPARPARASWSSWSSRRPSEAARPLAGDGAARGPQSEPARASGPGLLGGLLQQFEPEIDKLKATAIGMLVGAARDVLKDKLPPALAANVDEILDNVTRKAGGEVIHGRVLSPSHETPAHGAGAYPA